MTNVEDVADWETRIAAASSEWLALVPEPVDIADWEIDYAEIDAGYRGLIAAGEWLSGREDLLSIIGRRKSELTHSAAIAWLLKPTARHGLGSRVLDGICRELWPDEHVPEGPVAVDTEITRTSGSDVARADVVAWAGDTILVIENKLDADEQSRQVERLFSVWEGEGSDVRWIFLTPDGRLPTTAGTDDVLAAWRALGYQRLAGIIADAVEAAEPSDALGRRSVEQYLATLRSLYGRPIRGSTS